MFDPIPQNQPTEFLLYTAPNGAIKVEVLLNNETIWLPQKRMAELFGVGVPAISKHLKNIFDSGELVEEVVVSILEITTEHGAMAGLTQTLPVKYYNLDAVISVGYRVNSTQATQFRIWATQRIKDYIIKGFAMDDERLKNGRYFGKDYFEKNQKVKDKSALIEDVRRMIRASLGNRAKESLVVDFINQADLDQFSDKTSVIEAFFAYAQAEQKQEAETLIQAESLNEEAAKRYLLTSLKREYASDNGTELNGILPKMSPLNPKYLTMKQCVFQKTPLLLKSSKALEGRFDLCGRAGSWEDRDWEGFRIATSPRGSGREPGRIRRSCS